MAAFSDPAMMLLLDRYPFQPVPIRDQEGWYVGYNQRIAPPSTRELKKLNRTPLGGDAAMVDLLQRLEPLEASLSDVHDQGYFDAFVLLGLDIGLKSLMYSRALEAYQKGFTVSEDLTRSEAMRLTSAGLLPENAADLLLVHSFEEDKTWSPKLFNHRWVERRLAIAGDSDAAPCLASSEAALSGSVG